MKIFTVFLVIMSFVSSTWAQGTQEENPFKNLDYPELQVAPRASERLQKMVEEESGFRALNQWPMMTSGLMTLVAGLQSQGKYKEEAPTDGQKRDSDMASKTAMAVGGAWIAVGGYLSFRRPIAAGMDDIRKIPTRDRRGELNKERAAEELMEKTAKLQSTLNNLAVWTNLGASLYVTSYADEDNKVYGLLGVTASLLPWIFPSMYEFHYNKHLEYKRKIYAPLVWMDISPVDMSPRLSMSWSF